MESIYSSVQGEYQASLAESDDSNLDLSNLDSLAELLDNAMDKK